MAVPSQRPYDWTIDLFSFRLAPADVVGRQPHDIKSIPLLAPQISSTAEMQYSDINREVEVAHAQDDMSEGLATALRFNLANQKKVRYAKGVDTSWPTYVIGQSKITTIGAVIGVEPTLAVQRGNVSYMAAGANLYQVTTSAVTLDTTMASAITALYVWGGNLIVGLGSSTNFRHRSSDTSGGAFTDGGRAGHFFTSIGDQLYLGRRPSTLEIADQIAGPWAAYDVGDSSFNITSLANLDNLIVIGKEDGPYAFDSDLSAQPIVPELKLQADAQVCKAMLPFNRDLYLTTRFGMIRIRSGETIKSLGLDLLADPALPGTPPETRPTSFTSDGRFLYANVISGAGVYVWKLDLAGNWHNALYRADLGEMADLLQVTAKIGSTAKNAIVLAYKVGANWQLAYAMWPRTADPAKDTDYQYDTTKKGVLRTLDYVASLPTVEKYASRLKLVNDDASAARPITAYIYADNDPQKKLGDFQSTEAFEEQTLPEPENFHRESLEFELQAEATKSPKLRAFHLSTAFLERVVRRHTVHLLAATAVPLATGGRAHARQDYKAIVDRLRDLRKTRAVVDCRDEDDRKFVAYLDDIQEWTAFPRGGKGFDPTKVITATLDEVADD